MDGCLCSIDIAGRRTCWLRMIWQIQGTWCPPSKTSINFCKWICRISILARHVTFLLTFLPPFPLWILDCNVRRKQPYSVKSSWHLLATPLFHNSCHLYAGMRPFFLSTLTFSYLFFHGLYSSNITLSQTNWQPINAPELSFEDIGKPSFTPVTLRQATSTVTLKPVA